MFFLISSRTWESQKKMIALETEIITNEEFPWICADSEEEEQRRRGGQPCIKSDFRFRLTCMRSEGDHKYRVMQTGDG